MRYRASLSVINASRQFSAESAVEHLTLDAGEILDIELTAAVADPLHVEP